MSNEKQDSMKIVLGEYMGVKVDVPSAELTEEEINWAYEENRKKMAQQVDVKGRAAQPGDIAIIDFTGYCDGEQFEGGSGNAYPLELGSKSFIEGFEEQLTGTNAGDEVDVNVTFPADYPAQNLAGKDALFKVKVGKLIELRLPELEESAKADIRRLLGDQKKAEMEQKYENALVAAVVADSEVEIPQELIDNEAKLMVKEWRAIMSSHGMDPDQYYAYTRNDDESMAESFRDKAHDRMKARFVLDGIARMEKLTVSDDEVHEAIVNLAKQYNMSEEDLKKNLGQDKVDALKADITMRKAVDLIMLNADREQCQ